MTAFGATGLTWTRPITLRTFLVVKAQLDRFVTIAILRPQLQYMAGPGLDNRYRNGFTGYIVDLSHPDLLAEYSLNHVTHLLVYGLSPTGYRKPNRPTDGLRQLPDAEHIRPASTLSRFTRTASLHFSLPCRKQTYLADALILMSTPAGRLNLFNASIVFAVA